MTTEQINMMMQLMMQQSQVSSSNAGKDSNGDSFQDLISQKQDAVSDTKPSSDTQHTQSDPTNNDKVQQPTGENQQENVTDVSDLQPYAVQKMTQENVSAATAQTTVVDAIVPQAVQTTVAAETAMPVAQQTTTSTTVQVPQQAMQTAESQVTPEVIAPQESASQQSMQQNPLAHTEQQFTGENT